MGYEGVEFAGYHGFKPSDLRLMLDDNGLEVAGSHVRLDTVLEDELEKTVQFNKAIGNRFLIVPGLPEERRGSLSAWKETATLFGQLAEDWQLEVLVEAWHKLAVQGLLEDPHADERGLVRAPAEIAVSVHGQFHAPVFADEHEAFASEHCRGEIVPQSFERFHG